jgi:hypothetical protein
MGHFGEDLRLGVVCGRGRTDFPLRENDVIFGARTNGGVVTSWGLGRSSNSISRANLDTYSSPSNAV